MWGRFGNYRDVLLEGDCDKVINRLCAKLGWTEELGSTARRFESEARKNGGRVDAESLIFREGEDKHGGAAGDVSANSAAMRENLRRNSNKCSGGGSERSRGGGRSLTPPKLGRTMRKSRSWNSLPIGLQGAPVYPH